MKKSFISALAAYIGILLCTAFIQQNFATAAGIKIFPDLRDFFPNSVNEFMQWQEDREKKPVEAKKEKYFHSGENNSRLARFFSRLNSLEEKKITRVRIIHWGDSLIWGDNMTAVMKRNFQRDFGDGGRGLVSSIETSATKLKDHVNNTVQAGFQLHSLGHKFIQNGTLYLYPSINYDLGFTGESGRVLSPFSELKFKTAEGFKPWNRIDLFIRAPRNIFPDENKYSIKLKSASGESEKNVSMKSGEVKILSFENLNTGTADISFSGSNFPLPYIDGINLETSGGIAYSTPIRMGTHMSWLGAVPEEYFEPGMKFISPDLIIFQYGINEAASLDSVAKLTPELMKEQMRSWVKRLKKYSPNADVLVIGTPERLNKKTGALLPMKDTLEVRRLQREICDESGFAFFDTYEFLGGPGHMQGLVQSGMALDDYMHLSVRGGNLMAAAIYDTLINSYKAYLGKTAEIKKVNEIRAQTERNKSLLFNTKGFGFFFIIVLIISFFMLKKFKWRIIFITAASFYFYASLAVWPVLVLLLISVSDYLFGQAIRNSRQKGFSGKKILAGSIITDLGILFAFKYAFFTASSLNSAAQFFGQAAALPVYNIVLPAGISFFIFKSLSYTIDIYRGKCNPARSLSDYIAFVSFFPQLLAGPISRSSDFFKFTKGEGRLFAAFNKYQMPATMNLYASGVFLILCGLIKKAGADWLGANLVDRVFANPGMFSSVEMLTAVVSYGAQIYGDFSGYTDIAIGCAALLGFKLPENFNRPYTAFSITDFWRRWHITLGAWFRDYLYISIGGNKKRVYFNLIITMLLCGLWHGAAVNFIMWGTYYGLFLAFERATGLAKKSSHKIINGFRIFITLAIVLFGWIIFRAASWQNFIDVLNSIAALKFSTPNLTIAIIAVTLLYYAVHFSPLKFKSYASNIFINLHPAFKGAAAAIVTILLYNVSIADIKSFIYFQF